MSLLLLLSGAGNQAPPTPITKVIARASGNTQAQRVDVQTQAPRASGSTTAPRVEGGTDPA